MDHQNSYGCRKCAYGHNLCAVARPGLRRHSGPGFAGRSGTVCRPPCTSSWTAPTAPTTTTRPNRLEPWQYDRALYRKRNEIERLFRRLKGFRRIFSRFDKLDVVFLAFIYFALIVACPRYLISVNTP